MKVAYLYERDADDPNVQSGRPRSILREFERAGFEIKRRFPLSPAPTGILDRLERRFVLLQGRRYFPGRAPRHLRHMAREAEAALGQDKVDFIFCPGTLPISHLKASAPVIFSSDSTFRSMAGYYEEFSELSTLQFRQFHRSERSALKNSSLMVYPSEWAANSATRDYHAPPERVAVIPSGANLGAANDAARVHACIKDRRLDRIEFVFVGKEWKRKGGDICLETLRLLERRGLDVRLHVIGSAPAIPDDLRDHVAIHGPLRPSISNERIRMETIFRTAHFLFTPSRAEAYGMVFCEANAFGLPCIATRTGGIPTIIRHGHNGILLPPEAGPADYASEIIRITSRPEDYFAMAFRSFGEFEQRLNWRAWMRAFMPRLESALARKKNV